MAVAMKKILILVNAVFCFLAFPVFSFAGSSGYITEREIAKAFLIEKGADPQKCNLKAKCSTSYAVLFGDQVNGLLVIVAKSDYIKYLDSPVLAYSLESSYFENGADYREDTINHIMKKYSRQIRYLFQNKNKYHPSGLLEHHCQAGPLLGEIAFSQSYPYNLRHPKVTIGGKDTACIVGCGPVALSQILQYYHWPSAAVGEYCYSVEDKYYRMAFSDYPYDWNSIKPKYKRNEPDSHSVFEMNKLLLCCGASLGAQMSPNGTSSSISNFKGALLCNWRYSPSAMLYEKISDQKAIPLIYQELDNLRPIIVSDDNHIFVCDGYSGDFLHYNLGWNSYGNGYYRVLCIPQANEAGLHFENMLTGIAPLLDKDNYTKSVRLSEAGQLSECLSAVDKLSLTELSISGPLNSDDVALLRRMAGAEGEGWNGSLMKLDLGNANIVQDDAASHYYANSASGLKLYYTTYETVNGITTERSLLFDMDNISPEQWQQMQELGLDRADDGSYRIVFDGNEFHLQYYLKDDEIGDYMFCKCSNLREIRLPKSAVSIGDYAFFNCCSLQKVTLFGNMDTIGDGAFSWTPRLEYVSIPESLRVHKLGKNLFDHTSRLSKQFIHR